MFIECKDGSMVNVSHVVSISKHDGYAWLATVDGAQHQTTFSYNYTRELAKSLVPANEGFQVIAIWFEDCDDPETFDIVKNLHRETVIAWKGTADNLEPVTLFSLAAGEMEDGTWAILDPAGSVIEPGNRLFVSLDHWVAEVRETLRAHCQKRSNQQV
jgi:hypothetical protein